MNTLIDSSTTGAGVETCRLSVCISKCKLDNLDEIVLDSLVQLHGVLQGSDAKVLYNWNTTSLG